jgi:hypothetical protein
MDYAELGKGTQQLQNAAKFTHHPSQFNCFVCLVSTEMHYISHRDIDGVAGKENKVIYHNTRDPTKKKREKTMRFCCCCCCSPPLQLELHQNKQAVHPREGSDCQTAQKPHCLVDEWRQ